MTTSNNEGSRSRPDNDLPSATLGKRRDTPFTYAPELLEAVTLPELDPPMPAGTFPAPWVALDCERFTSLCPVTGQPDWATIKIAFIPNKHLVESKSLKEYLNSFRMHGDFHEDVCRIILRDIIQCAQPRYAEVYGDFDSRGSIAIWPFAQWAQPGDDEATELLHHRRKTFSPTGWPGR